MSAPTTAPTRPERATAAGTAAPAPVGQGRLPAVGAVLIALVALVTAPFQGDALGPGTLRLAAGSAEVLAGDDWAPLAPGARVGLDTWVRATDGGAGAELALRDGTAELRPGARLRLIDRDRLELQRGSLLLDAEARWLVEVDLVTVAVIGVARLDLGPARRVGVYEGGAGVTAAERGTPVGAYEQVDLADVDALEARPLRYDADDPWDARMLAGAIAVDAEVATLERGLRAQYGTALQEPAFYRDFLAVDDTLAASLPGLAPRERDDRFGPPAPTLTAVVVATVLVEHTGRSPGEATASIRASRAAGATWGLVLAAEGLGTRELGAATETALRRRAIAVEEGRAAPVSTEAPADATDPDDGTTPDGTGTNAPEPPPGPSEPEPGSDEPDPDPVEDTVEEVDEGVGEAVDETDGAVDELLDSVPLPGDDGEGTPGPGSGLGGILDGGGEAADDGETTGLTGTLGGLVP